jgi:hypothetical protein
MAVEIMAPTALSILMTSFAEGTERNKALGVWSASGGTGAPRLLRESRRWVGLYGFGLESDARISA